MDFLLSKGAKIALEKLHKSGHEAVVVGGAVRDHFLGLKPFDFDVATSATPQEVLGIFSEQRTFTAGIKHGTVSVAIGCEIVEITTFRSDGRYFDCRHPQSVEFVGSLEEDLKRRDFTVNAICFDGENFIDPLGGAEDLKRGVLKCIGSAENRFKEDALRILRAVRFVSEFGFSVEENTKAALFAHKRLISGISAERIREEFYKILLGDHSFVALEEYRDTIAEIVPEIAPCFDFEQMSVYHDFDVYVHTVRAVSAAPKDITIRLAAFFHDIGKPEKFFIGADGHGHFYGHPEASRRIAEVALNRLKCPKSQINDVLLLVERHDAPIIPEGGKGTREKYILRALNRYGAENFFRLIEIKRADNLAQKDPPGRNILQRLAELDNVKNDAKALLSGGACVALRDLAINGDDLKTIGLCGRDIGKTLETLLGMVLDGAIANDRERLLREARRLNKK
ncbi:MAG: CCA tRNA nucleotidyltransferase [Clostridia bacterium]|nr:CCA tRNA nucleotidyltransferase [Clostridia bacterium]